MVVDSTSETKSSIASAVVPITYRTGSEMPVRAHAIILYNLVIALINMSSAVSAGGGYAEAWVGLPREDLREPIFYDQFILISAQLTCMDGVPGDRDLPLLAHITEFRSRLIVVSLALGVGTVIMYPFSGTLIGLIWSNLLPDGTQMTVYAPLELIVAKFTFSFMVSFAFCVPILLYELLAFAGKGLYPEEKRFFMTIVSISILLFLAGAGIAYLAIVPVIFKYIMLHSEDIAVAGLSLRTTLSVVGTLVLGFGLMFQFPILVVAAIKMGLLERKQLKNSRMIVYGALITFAIFVTPDATGVSQLIVFTVFLLLFEFSLAAARFV